jgi:hypothetical protein
VVGAEPDPALPPVPPAPPARPITPKREPEAGPAPQQPPLVTHPGRRHAFFDLKSPSTAPRTPHIATIPLIVPPTPQPAPSQLRHRRAPVQEPSPEPEPEPGPSRRSTRSNKGHAPPANQWNATDYLHGNQQPQKVKSYKETGTRSSVSPAPQSLPFLPLKTTENRHQLFPVKRRRRMTMSRAMLVPQQDLTRMKKRMTTLMSSNSFSLVNAWLHV